MTDPRQSDVWGKKPEVADRTINERKYCKPCDYYYSEMYTCPICYGDDRAIDRIIKLLEDYDFSTIWRQVAWNPDAWESFGSDDLIAFIKGGK